MGRRPAGVRVWSPERWLDLTFGSDLEARHFPPAGFSGSDDDGVLLRARRAADRHLGQGRLPPDGGHRPRAGRAARRAPRLAPRGGRDPAHRRVGRPALLDPPPLGRLALGQGFCRHLPPAAVVRNRPARDGLVHGRSRSAVRVPALAGRRGRPPLVVWTGRAGVLRRLPRPERAAVDGRAVRGAGRRGPGAAGRSGAGLVPASSRALVRSGNPPAAASGRGRLRVDRVHARAFRARLRRRRRGFGLRPDPRAQPGGVVERRLGLAAGGAIPPSLGAAVHAVGVRDDRRSVRRA